MTAIGPIETKTNSIITLLSNGQIQAALDSKQAALEDVKKADRRIITDLKREMTKILRQTKMEKDEQNKYQI